MRAALVALICLWGCRALPQGPRPPSAEAASFPLALLELARDERVRMDARRVHSASEPLDTVADEDGIVRTVRVGPSLPERGSPRSLLAGVLRNAEARRPREQHPTRLLYRVVRVRGPSRHHRQRARAGARAARQAAVLCLARDIAARPGVVVDAPTALVVEQALRTGPIHYRVTVVGSGVEVLPAVSSESHTCLREALRSSLVPRTSVTVSVFSQLATSYNDTGGLHRSLASLASARGWTALERGEHEAALAYFRDAYWLFHRPEYLYQQALALEALGRRAAAAGKLEAYLGARPHAPEAPRIRAQIHSRRRSG